MQFQSFYFRFFLGLSLFLFITFTSLGQENRSIRIGASISVEDEENEQFGIIPSFGVFAIREFTPKSAVEVGVFFRTYQRSFFVNFTPPDGSSFSQSFTVSEGYLNFPVLYRFSTRFANFSLGPNVDVFSSWNQIDDGDIEVTSYSVSPRVKVGPLLKIGRNIPLKGTLVFEPELRLGIRSFFGETFIGIGVRIHQEMSLKK